MAKSKRKKTLRPRSQKASEFAHVQDLKQDPQNARKHGERNIGTIASALQEVGAARSIVIDEAGVIRAGNATQLAAIQAGVSKLKIVDADGDTLVAVRRKGLTPEQWARLALYDNRAAELAEGWEAGVLRDLQAQGISLEGLWTDDELLALFRAPEDPSGGEGSQSLADRFGVPPFSVLDARQGYWQDRKRAWLSLGIQSELGRGGGTWVESAETGSPLDRQDRYSKRANATPGGAAMPAANYSKNRARGDGRGRPIA